MAKLTDFQTPTGAKGNILHPSDWLSLIVGSAVLFLTVGVGQHLANKVGSRVPDTSINQPWQSAPAPAPTNQKITL
jgi:hypothetical protein